MKKTIIFFMSLSALTIVSCNKEVAPSEEINQPAVNAQRSITVNLVPADELTKTTLEYPNGIGSASKLVWENGDKVSYWTGTSDTELETSKTATIKDNGRFDAEVGTEDTVIKIKYPAVEDGTAYSSSATSVAEEQNQAVINVFNGENLPMTGSATFASGTESVEVNATYSTNAAVVRWGLKKDNNDTETRMLKAFSMNLYNYPGGYASIERYNVALGTPVELSSDAQYVYIVCNAHNNTYLEPGSFTLNEDGNEVVYTYCGATQSQRNGDAANANNRRLLASSMSRVSVAFNDNLFKKTVVDLSAGETSNCYIVSAPGEYSFDASVRGNGTVVSDTGIDSGTIEGGYGAIALWRYDESNNEKTGNTDIIKKIRYENGRISFTAIANNDGALTKGNVLIALKDSEGTILWSWHIWMTEIGDDITVDGVNFLDRNLGAFSNNPTDAKKTWGAVYQWGRKDPLFVFNQIKTGSVYYYNKISTETARVAVTETIKNPETFYLGRKNDGDAGNYNWDSAVNINKWADNVKTMYDPCPKGYKVCNNAQLQKVIPAKGASISDFSTSNGITLKGVYFPATHTITPTAGQLQGLRIDLWTTSRETSWNAHNSYRMYIKNNTTYAYDQAGGAYAHSIRCVKQ